MVVYASKSDKTVTFCYDLIDKTNILCYTITQIHNNTNIIEVSIMAERNLVNLTVTMTREERKSLKQIALDKDMTVSALLREWLKEYQAKESVKK